MRLTAIVLFTVFFFGTAVVGGTGKNSSSTRLNGTPGSDPTYGSGWIDLNPPQDFKRGDKLRLSIGGSAKRIVVRLLAQGQSPKTAAGVISPEREVKGSNNNRFVEVVLEQDYSRIKQISVHGGNDLWEGMFKLGPDNGPATLISVVLVRGEK